MELADVFEKIANNARLTPQELDFLKVSMKQVQLNNSFVYGMKTRDVDINVNVADSKKFVSGNQSVSGAFLKAVGGILGLATLTTDTIDNWSIHDGESMNGFRFSGEYIHVPEPGLYRIFVHVYWTANSTGTFRLATIRSYDHAEGDIRSPDANQITSHWFTDFVYIPSVEDNEGITLEGRHNASSSLNFSAKIFIERIGEWRWLTS